LANSSEGDEGVKMHAKSISEAVTEHPHIAEHYAKHGTTALENPLHTATPDQHWFKSNLPSAFIISFLI